MARKGIPASGKVSKVRAAQKKTEVTQTAPGIEDQVFDELAGGSPKKVKPILLKDDGMVKLHTLISDGITILCNKLEEIRRAMNGVQVETAAASRKATTVEPVERTSHKMNKDEKEALKANLLKKAPYTKEELEGISGRTVKQLASAMEININQANERIEG